MPGERLRRSLVELHIGRTQPHVGRASARQASGNARNVGLKPDLHAAAAGLRRAGGWEAQHVAAFASPFRHSAFSPSSAECGENAAMSSLRAWARLFAIAAV